MAPLKVGVFGVGTIAAMHLKSYAAHPDVELVAVLDINAERARTVAAAHGIPRAYDVLSDALADPELEAVSICTWNDSHADLAVAALEAGLHVLVEKPMATTAADAERIAAAAAASGRVVQVGFVRRFSTSARVLKQFIDAGDLGEIYYARASNLRRIGNPGGWFADRSRSGGGPLIDIGVHVIDLCWWLMGSPRATTVSANSYAQLGNRANVTNLPRYKVSDYDPDLNSVEDLVNAIIRFDNGASLMLDTSYSLHAHEDRLSAAVYGDRGGAEIEPELKITTERHDTVLNLTPQIRSLSFDFDEGFANEIAQFVGVCRAELPPVAPVEHGVEIARILEGIYASAAAGHEVVLG